MLESVWAHVKGLAIIGWAVKAVKQLWPFILIIVFWPQINSLLGGLLPFWDQYMSTFSEYVMKLSSYVREIPYLGDAFVWLDNAFTAIRYRLIDILQTGKIN